MPGRIFGSIWGLKPMKTGKIAKKWLDFPNIFMPIWHLTDFESKFHC